MTTPAASVLGRIARVVEAGGDISRSNPPDKRDGLRGELGSYNGDKLDRALAALPVATDEGAVEQLAQWLYEAGATRGALPWGTAVGTTDHYCRLAKAILTELLAGGKGER